MAANKYTTIGKHRRLLEEHERLLAETKRSSHSYVSEHWPLGTMPPDAYVTGTGVKYRDPRDAQIRELQEMIVSLASIKTPEIAVEVNADEDRRMAARLAGAVEELWGQRDIILTRLRVGGHTATARQVDDALKALHLVAEQAVARWK